MTTLTVHVVEVGMAAPDIIFMRVRDQEIVKGSLLQLASPDSAARGSTVLRDPVTGLAGSHYARVGGQVNGVEKMFLRFHGNEPTAYADRDVMDEPTSYATIGGRTVEAVYRISLPFDQTFAYDGQFPGAQKSSATFEHTLFLKLDGNLPQGGPYTISVTGNTFPATAFTFSDTSTRAYAIKATTVGHRPADGDKTAHLSLWIPHYLEEGAVDLPTLYGITQFHIIDANGTIHFTGTPTFKVGPTTLETALGGNYINYVSTTKPPRIITAITNANPGEITFSEPHGFIAGDVLRLRGIGGSIGTWLESAKIVVAAHDTDPANKIYIGVGSTNENFVSVVNTTSLGTYTKGTYLTTGNPPFNLGYDSLAHPCNLANRAATYVYWMDYSAWTANRGGLYRVYVPGLGVSDPFRVDEAVHYQTAKIHMKGYYNQNWGRALESSVGGVTRGVNYKDGTNGVTIFESNLPAAFATESGPAIPIPSGNGAIAPYITATRATGWYGGFSDAGDWDTHLYRHAEASWNLCEFGYRLLPAATRDVHLGYPKSSISIDASLYAGTDVIGDAVHMAIWYLDTYRRTQKANGRVYGGLGYSGGAASGAGGDDFFPSSHHHMSAYVHCADHTANYMYAAAAAKIAEVLTGAGATAAGATWLASAELAWDWAMEVHRKVDKTSSATSRTIGTGSVSFVVNSQFPAVAGDTVRFESRANTGNFMQGTITTFSSTTMTVNVTTTGGAGTLADWDVKISGWDEDYYYVTDLNLKTNAGFSDATFRTHLLNVNTRARFMRLWAAGSLFKATGELDPYGNVHRRGFPQGQSEEGGHGVWDYSQAPTVDATHATHKAGYLAGWCVDSGYNEHFGSGTTAYRYVSVGSSFTANNMSDYYIMMRGFTVNASPQDRTNKYLNLIHAGENFFTGANQQGISCTTGLGLRYHNNALIRDREALCITTADWQGATLFTWWNNTLSHSGTHFSNFGTDSSFTANRLLATGQTDRKVVTPDNLAIPNFQKSIDNSYMVYNTEFVTQWTIVRAFIAALWRHTWDGNTRQEYRSVRRGRKF
jgi:hypothetical protein